MKGFLNNRQTENRMHANLNAWRGRDLLLMWSARTSSQIRIHAVCSTVLLKLADKLENKNAWRCTICFYFCLRLNSCCEELSHLRHPITKPCIADATYGTQTHGLCTFVILHQNMSPNSRIRHTVANRLTKLSTCATCEAVAWEQLRCGCQRPFCLMAIVRSELAAARLAQPLSA